MQLDDDNVRGEESRSKLDNIVNLLKEDND